LSSFFFVVKVVFFSNFRGETKNNKKEKMQSVSLAFSFFFFLVFGACFS